MKAQKIKIQIENEIYELPTKVLGVRNGKQRMYITPPAAGSLVKQFAKKFFPQYVVKVKSNSFANGNSLDVWVSTPMGYPIPQTDFDKITQFAKLWQYGKFDGMTDSYEYYDTSGKVTDKGTEMVGGVKYVHTDNRACFGTVESILFEVISQGREFEEATKYYTDSTTKGAVPKAKFILDKIMDGSYKKNSDILTGCGITLTKIN